MGDRKTPFHAASYKFLASVDDSRKLFSNLVDVFSAIAARDYTNDWAPDLAERCFRFNRAQKKLQRDLREWVDSITEQDVEMVGRWFGYGSGGQVPPQDEGGDHDRYRTKKTSAARSSGKAKKKSATIKGKATRRR